MKYCVFNNNKPCNYVGLPYLKGKGWDNNSFDTFEEALQYLKEWLGIWDMLPDDFAANQIYCYNGFDCVEIRTM